jgi:hypothetical protein
MSPACGNSKPMFLVGKICAMPVWAAFEFAPDG